MKTKLNKAEARNHIGLPGAVLRKNRRPRPPLTSPPLPVDLRSPNAVTRLHCSMLVLITMSMPCIFRCSYSDIEFDFVLMTSA